MAFNYLTQDNIRTFVRSALAEDLGEGDHSSLASIPENHDGRARLLIKSEGVLAGVELAKYIFEEVDPSLSMHVLMQDGSPMKFGDIAFHIEGNVRSILGAERVTLNCMQRMSGISSYTNQLRNLVAHTKVKLLDTRKTTPNFRLAEKWAVTIGGGTNHRFGLFDMIMLKDNHIDFAGGIRPAIESTKRYLTEKALDLKIEVEARTIQDVEQILQVGGVFRVLLDNMDPTEIKQAVALVNNRIETEASGGITALNLVEMAETGVDYISLGALTHSAKSLDMSLKAF